MEAVRVCQRLCIASLLAMSLLSLLVFPWELIAFLTLAFALPLLLWHRQVALWPEWVGYLKWTSLLLSIMVVVVWIASLRWRIVGKTPYFFFETSSPGYLNEVFGTGLYFLDHERPSTEWLPGIDYQLCSGLGSSRGYYVPLWLVLCAFLAVAIACIYAKSKWRQPKGLCQTCGYDLTGNVSGTCPECGTRIEAASGTASQPVDIQS